MSASPTPTPASSSPSTGRRLWSLLGSWVSWKWRVGLLFLLVLALGLGLFSLVHVSIGTIAWFMGIWTFAGLIALGLMTRLAKSTIIVLLLGTAMNGAYFSYTSYGERNFDVSHQVKYVRYMVKHHTAPPDAYCFICHHPPLFYASAAVAHEVGRSMKVPEPLRASQLVPFFSVLLMGLSATYLTRRFGASTAAINLATALMLFWPYTLVMNARIHNDSLASGLMMAGIYACVRWFQDQDAKSLLFAALLCVLSVLTKTNGYVLVILLFCASALVWFRSDDKIAFAKTKVPILLALVLALGSYASNRGSARQYEKEEDDKKKKDKDKKAKDKKDKDKKDKKAKDQKAADDKAADKKDPNLGDKPAKALAGKEPVKDKKGAPVQAEDKKAEDKKAEDKKADAKKPEGKQAEDKKPADKDKDKKPKKDEDKEEMRKLSPEELAKLEEDNKKLSLSERLLGSAGKIGARSWMGNEPFNYLYFDTEGFLKHPYVLARHDGSGRQFFWNHVLKSSLFSTHNHRPDYETSYRWNRRLAGILNGVFLAMLVFMIASLTKIRREHQWKYSVLVLAGLGFLGGGAAFRILIPHSHHSDFRHMFPVLLPMVVAYALMVDAWRREKKVMHWVGLWLAVAMVVGAIVYYVPKHKWMTRSANMHYVVKESKEVSRYAKAESSWNEYQYVVLEPNQRLWINFDGAPTGYGFSIATDHNDIYEVRIVGAHETRVMDVGKKKASGIAIFTEHLVPPVQGVRAVEIRPRGGDVHYSVGHFILNPYNFNKPYVPPKVPPKLPPSKPENLPPLDKAGANKAGANKAGANKAGANKAGAKKAPIKQPAKAVQNNAPAKQAAPAKKSAKPVSKPAPGKLLGPKAQSPKAQSPKAQPPKKP